MNIKFNSLSFSKAEERIKERIIIDELKHKQRKLLIQSEMQNEYTSLSYLMISLLLNTIFPQILYWSEAQKSNEVQTNIKHT